MATSDINAILQLDDLRSRYASCTRHHHRLTNCRILRFEGMERSDFRLISERISSYGNNLISYRTKESDSAMHVCEYRMYCYGLADRICVAPERAHSSHKDLPLV